MRTSEILLSVIVPVFNGERFLGQALESILRQQPRDAEIIVMDDGSTDGTAKIARAHEDRIRYGYQENMGPSAARNAGLALARGEFIGFLDADDIWPPGSLTCLLEILHEEPAVDVVIGKSQFLKVRTGDKQPDECDEVLKPRTYLQLGSGLFRRTAFEKVGLFNTDLRFSEDLDWFLRAGEQGIFIKAIETITLLHRLHENNMTRGTSRNELQIVSVLKRSLDRRRRREACAPSSVQALEYLLGSEKKARNEPCQPKRRA